MTKVTKTLVQIYQNSESGTSIDEIGTVVNDSGDDDMPMHVVSVAEPSLNTSGARMGCIYIRG